MKLFDLGNGYQVVCEWKKTRMAFKHEAALCIQGNVIEKTKICYQNRTWESYEYQSVIRKVIDKHFPKDDAMAAKLMKKADDIGKGRIDDMFKTVKMVAAFGDLLCDKPKDQAAWKKKMLSTVPGIDFPAGFDNLPEEERNRRLDNALKVL